MKDTAQFRRQGFSLVPSGNPARALLSKIIDGAYVFVEIWSPRNMAQHRKYFAILRNVVEATGDRWVSQEHLRKDILLTLGRYDEHISKLTGECTKIPHSMKVASMKKADFERLYDDTIKLLTDALGCDPEMLLEEAA